MRIRGAAQALIWLRAAPARACQEMEESTPGMERISPTLPTRQSGFRLQQLGKARLFRRREVAALGLDLFVGATAVAPPRNDEEHQRTAAEQRRRTEPQQRRVQR